MIHLARTVYEGANHTHLAELLSEREGLHMGRTTLRRILVNAGLSSPRRRRPPKHRVRRQRMSREGMPVQMDGSYHRWLGKDGPQFTILFAVDGAAAEPFAQAGGFGRGAYPAGQRLTSQAEHRDGRERVFSAIRLNVAQGAAVVSVTATVAGSG